MKTLSVCFLAAIGIAASVSSAFAQDHGHWYVGATSWDQDAPLVIENAGDYATNSRYINTLTFTNGGQYAGYYQGNLTFQVDGATTPAPGSWIFAQVVSVDGPPGGAFGWWEVGATNPTISLDSGTTGTNVFQISSNDGSPGSDPYGHIHGRRFTATKPGIYTVGFRVLDRSTNGANGGPIHTPSDVMTMYFQAGINLASITRAEGSAAVTFGAAAFNTFYLEYATNLLSTNWTTVGVVGGNDSLQTLIDPEATDPCRFYRVRVTTP